MKKTIFSNLRINGNTSFAKQAKSPGSAPGIAQHTGKRLLDKAQITVTDYDETTFEQTELENIQDVKPSLDRPTKTWINVCGLHDIEKLSKIWNYFDLHPLVQEDIVNTSQRPKVEYYQDYIFYVLRMLSFSTETSEVKMEQISIVLGDGFVLSFQETDANYFHAIYDRLKIKDSRIRRQGIDYLMYALLDASVDYYFKVIEYFGDHIEVVEDELLEEPDEETLQKIHQLRRQITYFRKSVWPLRDAINTTIRDESRLVSQDTKLYLRDVYDHMIQIIDNIDNNKDIVLGLHDMYMSNMSNRMNEVMKVLTIISTIFIPLTFIAGIYGMNFDPQAGPYSMPELSWYWGYPASLAAMFIIAVIMIFYFKKKGWL